MYRISIAIIADNCEYDLFINIIIIVAAGYTGSNVQNATSASAKTTS